MSAIATDVGATLAWTLSNRHALRWSSLGACSASHALSCVSETLRPFRAGAGVRVSSSFFSFFSLEEVLKEEEEENARARPCEVAASFSLLGWHFGLLGWHFSLLGWHFGLLG
ncbi:MAG: hypothetical protein OT477_12950 [Chloroflexi bacterium]|nr:hypothetical protein [Chloroflexota bacterium]